MNPVDMLAGVEHRVAAAEDALKRIETKLDSINGKLDFLVNAEVSMAKDREAIQSALNSNGMGSILGLVNGQ